MDSTTQKKKKKISLQESKQEHCKHGDISQQSSGEERKDWNWNKKRTSSDTEEKAQAEVSLKELLNHILYKSVKHRSNKHSELLTSMMDKVY
jgi:hypothetical protein